MQRKALGNWNLRLYNPAINRTDESGDPEEKLAFSSQLSNL